MRHEVLDLIRTGSLPSEDGSEQEIDEAERLLSRIPKPLTNEEAHALTSVFGPDDCYGMAWTLLRAIETAPDASIATYDDGNPWVRLLNERLSSSARPQ